MQIYTIEGYIQNIYLVAYPDKLMLLDGASRADVKTIVTYITEQLGRPLSELKLVVVTHMHPDHAGAAHKLRLLTGCKIASSVKETHWYSGLAGTMMFVTDLVLAKWVARRMKKPSKRLWYQKKLVVDVPLFEGQNIPEFEDWQVWETPGHTDRDLSLLHSNSRLVYVADLMVKVKGRLIAPFPIFHPNKYRRSVDKVYLYRPDTVLLAHGGQVNFNEEAYQHLVKVSPATPMTHWRVSKIKALHLCRQVFRLGNKKGS